MSDLAQALAEAEAEVALWSEVENEWRTPNGDLTAYFVRRSAQDHREQAEQSVKTIKAAIAALAQSNK